MSKTIPKGVCQCGCGRETPIAPRNRKALGWVKGEPLKFLRGHNARYTHGPETGPDEKWCARCDTVKPRTEFFKAASQVDGLQGHCKECMRDKGAAYRKANAKALNDKTVAYRREKRLGITQEEYELLLDMQDHRCGICKEPERVEHKHGKRAMAVDHDHTTGRIRGLLCSHCNRALGLFRDSADVLRSAEEYLSRHGA